MESRREVSMLCVDTFLHVAREIMRYEVVNPEPPPRRILFIHPMFLSLNFIYLFIRIQHEQ